METSEAVYSASDAFMALTIPSGVSLPAAMAMVDAVPLPGVIVMLKEPPEFNDWVLDEY